MEFTNNAAVTPTAIMWGFLDTSDTYDASGYEKAQEMHTRAVTYSDGVELFSHVVIVGKYDIYVFRLPGDVEAAKITIGSDPVHTLSLEESIEAAIEWCDNDGDYVRTMARRA